MLLPVYPDGETPITFSDHLRRLHLQLTGVSIGGSVFKSGSPLVQCNEQLG